MAPQTTVTRKQWLEGLASKTADLELLGALAALEREAHDSEALLGAVKRMSEIDDQLDVLKERAKSLGERRKAVIVEIKEIRAALRNGPDLFDLAERESKFLEAKAELSERAAALLFVIDEKVFDDAMKKASKLVLEEAITFNVAYGDLEHYEKWRIDLIKKRMDHLLTEEKKKSQDAKAAAEKAEAEKNVVTVEPKKKGGKKAKKAKKTEAAAPEQQEELKGEERAREQGRQAARECEADPDTYHDNPYVKPSYRQAWEDGFTEESSKWLEPETAVAQ